MDIWGYKYPCSLYPKGKRAHTLPEEAFWRQKGAFQILLHLQKLQAILSRGRTWESRGITGENVAFLGKGADPTEEAQEKKEFCVDTPTDGVDTGHQSLKQIHEDSVHCVDTIPGSVDTSPRFLKTQLPDWDSVSTQPILLHLQKLQAILSRGRTWESRGISGEKVALLGKGADPTEEAQEKKDFCYMVLHFPSLFDASLNSYLRSNKPGY
ncbi:hypothetical protein Taro_041715 [Colocasia esculenta]|uniref:Uncharacterized protein n=1 Tax=Colocasia esculenta TaxID=4460 RepID=A0A843WWM3_COLES|nr:hypothetical protein [Colocasia esculenta]